jgi:hypothetical protein
LGAARGFETDNGLRIKGDCYEILYVFFRLTLFFLLVVLRFFPKPVFLFKVAIAFCAGFGFGRGLGFAGLLVRDSSLLVAFIGPGGVEDVAVLLFEQPFLIQALRLISVQVSVY